MTSRPWRTRTRISSPDKHTTRREGWRASTPLCHIRRQTHSYSGADGEPHTKVHTYWTQKGRLFIYGLMKEDGILPLIERGA